MEGFSSESELLSHYEKTGLNYTIMALLFRDTNSGNTPTKLNYDIRIHEKGLMWHTNKLYETLMQYMPGMGKYIYLSFEFILTKLHFINSQAQILIFIVDFYLYSYLLVLLTQI